MTANFFIPLEEPILPPDSRTAKRESACSVSRLVEAHGGADQSLKRLLIDRFALVEIDGASGVALEAGVEET